MNTMAAAAVAAHNLGLDGTKARLVSDPRYKQDDSHLMVLSLLQNVVKGFVNRRYTHAPFDHVLWPSEL